MTSALIDKVCNYLAPWAVPSWITCNSKNNDIDNVNILAERYIQENCLNQAFRLDEDYVQQISSLAVFYYSTGNTLGNGPLRNIGWLMNGSCDPCNDSWGGISCSSSNNSNMNNVAEDDVDEPSPPSITSLNLGGIDTIVELDGTLPSELGLLTKLESLVLYKHDLYGTIPSEFGNLSHLVNLDLHGNDLSGPIPSELARLASLDTLYFQWNDITGTVPLDICENLTLSVLYVDCAENEIICDCCTLCCSDSVTPNTCGYDGCYSNNTLYDEAGIIGSSACCNGLKNICDLHVDEILFGTLHNAMATIDDGFFFLPSHTYSLEDALNAGYRGINIDICNCKKQIELCHGYCGLGSRGIKEVFTSINTFLNNNPSEVILIPIEINNNGAPNSPPVDINEIYYILQTIDGFVSKMYIHDSSNMNPSSSSSSSSWPTLQTLIDYNKRIIIFHYGGPDCSSTSPLVDPTNYCPPGLHYYWDYAKETEYSFLSIGDIEQSSSSCRITRGNGGTGDFFGINNFVTFPNDNTARQINGEHFLQNRIEECSFMNNNIDVNLLFIDYWDIGDVLEVVQNYNSALGAAKRKRSRKNRNLMME